MAGTKRPAQDGQLDVQTPADATAQQTFAGHYERPAPSFIAKRQRAVPYTVDMNVGLQQQFPPSVFPQPPAPGFGEWSWPRQQYLGASYPLPYEQRVSGLLAPPYAGGAGTLPFVLHPSSAPHQPPRRRPSKPRRRLPGTPQAPHNTNAYLLEQKFLRTGTYVSPHVQEDLSLVFNLLNLGPARCCRFKASALFLLASAAFHTGKSATLVLTATDSFYA